MTDQGLGKLHGHTATADLSVGQPINQNGSVVETYNLVFQLVMSVI